MGKLNDILHELGISKVKLAKFLGVSRQMIYNYLELDDLNKWPKDKKVMLFNLLGIKSAEELDNIKVDTDYINDVEMRIKNLFSTSSNGKLDLDSLYDGMSKRNKELLSNIINLIKEDLDDDNDASHYTYNYLFNFLQAMHSNKEFRYILSYVSKATGMAKPSAYVFDEDAEFIFEAIMFSAMTLYHSEGIYKNSKIIESHKRFLQQIDQKQEEKMSRTLELNTIKVQALKELGYTEVNAENAAEVFEKIAEIESR